MGWTSPVQHDKRCRRCASAHSREQASPQTSSQARGKEVAIRNTAQGDATAAAGKFTTQEEAGSILRMSSQRQASRGFSCDHGDNASATNYENGRLATWTRQRKPSVVEVTSLRDAKRVLDETRGGRSLDVATCKSQYEGTEPKTLAP